MDAMNKALDRFNNISMIISNIKNHISMKKNQNCIILQGPYLIYIIQHMH